MHNARIKTTWQFIDCYPATSPQVLKVCNTKSPFGLGSCLLRPGTVQIGYKCVPDIKYPRKLHEVPVGTSVQELKSATAIRIHLLPSQLCALNALSIRLFTPVSFSFFGAEISPLGPPDGIVTSHKLHRSQLSFVICSPLFLL